MEISTNKIILTRS